MFKRGKPVKNFPRYYDGHINITIPYYQAFHAEIINVVKAIENDPAIWLDTGCGTGTLVEKALVSFPCTKFVLADPSDEMLEVAKHKLEGKTEDRILFIKGCSTQEITCPYSESPDVITAVLCHHYLGDGERKNATKKCFELLRRGGTYITFENIRPLTLKGIEVGKANWKNYQIASGKSPGEAESHLERFGFEYFPITVEEHLSLLRACGFRVVELLWYSYMQAGFYCIK